MPRKTSYARKRTTKKRSVAKPRSRSIVVRSGGAMAIAGLGARKSHTVTISRTMRATEFKGALDEIVTDNGGTQNIGNFEFALDMLPQYSEFTKLFEEYCIKEVKITFMPAYNSNVAQTATNPTEQLVCRVPKLGFCPVYTGGSLPGTGLENGWLECEGYEQHDFDKTITVSLKPKILGDAYSDTISPTYSVSQDGNTWIPIASPSVLHYGLNWRVYDPSYNRLLYGISDPCGMAYITYTLGLRGAQ